MPLTVHINGMATDVPQPCSIAELLRDRGLDRTPCAVEVNRTLVPKRDHDRVAINQGDRIELVTLVGGG